jgi:hypothetical protein
MKKRCGSLVSLGILAAILVVGGCSGEKNGACVPNCENRVCGPDGCGGDCGACNQDQTCREDGVCVFSSCGNGLKDGDETDVDCGGGDCGKCADHRYCKNNNDCQNNSCIGEVPAAECVTWKNNCGQGDEEASEPNDTIAEAALLEPGTHTGGICNQSPDYYRINLAGEWRLELQYSSDVGDLDVCVWDEEIDDLYIDWSGNIYCGFTNEQSEEGKEIVEFTDSALIHIEGYHLASAPYQITLTPINR